MLVTELMARGNLFDALTHVRGTGLWYCWSVAGLCITVEGIEPALHPVLPTRQGCATVRVHLQKGAGADVGPVVGSACLMLYISLCAPQLPAHRRRWHAIKTSTAQARSRTSWKHLLCSCLACVQGS